MHPSTQTLQFRLRTRSGKIGVPTHKQVLGRWGETLVAKKFACPRCKRFFTLRRMPPNFKCADIICDFCGYLAQVKTATVADVLKVPSSVLGAAWGPQRERMKAGIYFPLFLVLRNGSRSAVYYLPTEFQKPKLFKKRAPLSAIVGPDGRVSPTTCHPLEKKRSCAYYRHQLATPDPVPGGAAPDTRRLARSTDGSRSTSTGNLPNWSKRRSNSVVSVKTPP
jgi:type II restriction enzyme